MTYLENTGFDSQKNNVLSVRMSLGMNQISRLLLMDQKSMRKLKKKLINYNVLHLNTSSR